MNNVAIVAIVAMFLAFLVVGTSGAQDPQERNYAAPEVILHVEPFGEIFFPLLPDRNPKR